MSMNASALANIVGADNLLTDPVTVVLDGVVDGADVIVRSGGDRDVLTALVAAGCRQDMHDAPRYEAYEASASFANGAASRTAPANSDTICSPACACPSPGKAPI